MMKKSRNILLFILVVLFTSCNNQEKKFKIGVSQCSDDAWLRNMNEEILREASFYDDVSVEIKTAFDSNQKQIRDVEEFLNEGVDVLIISPNEAVPLTPVVEKAMEMNVPVVLVDRKIASEDYTAFIGANNFEIGQEVGNYVVDKLRGKGLVAEIRGRKGSTPNLERHDGFVQAISKFPGIKIVFETDGSWQRKIARQKSEVLPLGNQKIDLVFAHNDEMASGVYISFSFYKEIRNWDITLFRKWYC